MTFAEATKIQFKYSVGYDDADKEIFETRSFPRLKRNVDTNKLRELGELVGRVIGADDLDYFKAYIVSTDEIPSDN